MNKKMAIWADLKKQSSDFITGCAEPNKRFKEKN